MVTRSLLYLLWLVVAGGGGTLAFLVSAKKFTFLPLFFVCNEVLWPSQPIGIMSSMVSLTNHTFSWAGLVL